MTDVMIQLDPTAVQADDNTRFNLKKSRIDSLKNSILEQSGILTPVEVEPLTPPINGFTHRLTSGFYRHRAAIELNAEQNAGLTLPAIVREVPDAKTRLLHQLAENMERENQSPMDRAVAIKKLLDAGVDRKEVRRLFSTTGGRKGNTTSPMSNAMLNILLRLLELPKAIQEKIHDGRVGLAAAYELGKVAPEKRQDVLDRAEKERIAQVDREEADERKWIAAEQKLIEAEAKEAEALSASEQAKLDAAQARELVSQKAEVLKAVQAKPYLSLDEEAKKLVTEELKAAAADVKGAQKVVKDAENRLAKALGTVKTAAETAEEQKAKLEAARKAVKPGKAGRGKSAGIGSADVKRAAKAEGESPTVNLNMSEIRTMLRDMQKEGVPARVIQIAAAFVKALDSKLTTKELIHDLGVITGEVKLNGIPQTGAAATALRTKIEGVTPATPAAKPQMPAAPAVKQGPVGKAK